LANLRIPGPTPLPPSVQNALARPMINHRGAEFKQLFKGLLSDLKTVFQTQNDVLILGASGTGGMEAALVNVISPGDGVLAVTVGYFGDRFATIAEVCGAHVHRLEFPWGTPADPQIVGSYLVEHPGTRAVLVTHNETSTGVINDVQAIAAAIRAAGEPSPLLIVDGISSVGAIDLPADAWGCDMVVTCSQKALMSPPGISMLSVSPRAWEVVEGLPRRSYYFDLRALRKTAKEGETPATPPVSDLFALREGVNLLLAEGLPNSFARHRRVGAKMRAGVAALGLELLADPQRASDTVTAIKMPDSLPADAIRTKLREEYGIVLAGGQGALKGKLIRVGHMGYVTEADVEAVLSAMRVVIQTYGTV